MAAALTPVCSLLQTQHGPPQQHSPRAAQEEERQLQRAAACVKTIPSRSRVAVSRSSALAERREASSPLDDRATTQAAASCFPTTAAD